MLQLTRFNAFFLPGTHLIDRRLCVRFCDMDRNFLREITKKQEQKNNQYAKLLEIVDNVSIYGLIIASSKLPATLLGGGKKNEIRQGNIHHEISCIQGEMGTADPLQHSTTGVLQASAITLILNLKTN